MQRSKTAPTIGTRFDIAIVGIDCAAAAADVGLAFGRSNCGRPEVTEVLCPGERTAPVVVEWLRNVGGPALIAFDAPLGWPAAMGDNLASHRAGDQIGVEAHALFRRETDRFVQRTLKKTPLDLGADRIARTAHAALRLLDTIRRSLDVPVSLAWSPEDLSGITAIEVYPAATLRAHALACTGYRKADQLEERKTLIACLRQALVLPGDLHLCEESADALDAVVCLLAAADFVEGRAMEPENRELAEREGWIWVARPEKAIVKPR